MLVNRRFLGAWRLVSFEARAGDGTVTYPLGRDPVGIIMWDDSGAMSAQLGPREPESGPYIAYYGILQAPDAEAGTLIHCVEAASAPRFRVDQVRTFRFVDADTLELSPPAGNDGSESVLVWRRIVRPGPA